MWDVLWPIIYVVVHACLVVRAITRPNRAPAARVAWVAVILAVPVVGFISYLALGETEIGATRTRRLREAEEALAAVPPTTPPAEVHEPARAMSDLLQSINGYGPVAGNRIQLLGDPDAPTSEPKRDSIAAIEALISAIEAARETVHLSFYIWLDDVHGGKVADAVASAAERGVACRVMADALGSRAFIAGRRWKQLADAGVHVLATLDDIPRLGHLAVGRVDLRNHRKIVVIDGSLAFCGSQNCADPEFRVEAEYAPWIDLWFRCEGPVVDQAQRLFLATWMAETDEDLASLVASAPAPIGGGVVAQMYGTGPITPGNAMSDSFVTALYSAREELVITSPYFGPDESLLHALCAAPRRGVKTTFITPGRNNSWAVAAAARSTYAALLHSGVEIYEYPLGLLHSKAITIDGGMALVGSANLDRRSLDLNFENNLLILDPDLTADIRRRQRGYQSVSRQITMADVGEWGLWRRLFDNTVAMATPVL